VTHFGYANVTGRTEQVLAHLRRVNVWDRSRALAHVYAAENLCSARTWTLDLTMRTGAGITVRRPEAATERAAAAERAPRTADAPAARQASPAAEPLRRAGTTPTPADEPRLA
jgi:hypothetical protein